MRVLLALFAIAAPATASAQTVSEWDLTTWPNAALLSEQTSLAGAFVLRRSVTCIPGEDMVTWRDYHHAERPAGARRCDTRCRIEMTVTNADAPRPSSYTERRLPWRTAVTQLPPEALKLAPGFTKACRLKATASVTAPQATETNLLLQDVGGRQEWTAAQPGWTILPGRVTVTDQPHGFVIPERAWEYGAMSELITTRQPALVRVKVEGRAGRSGVSLVSADAGKLVSGEHAVSAGEHATLYLRLDAGAQARILLRNYDNDGVGGVLRVEAVEVIGEAALPPADLEALASEVR